MKILKCLGLVVLAFVLCLSLSVGCFAGEANLSGDATGDKILDVRDAVRMKKFISYAESSINLDAVDFDGDEDINGDELVVVRKMLIDYIEPEMIIKAQTFDKF